MAMVVAITPTSPVTPADSSNMLSTLVFARVIISSLNKEHSSLLKFQSETGIFSSIIYKLACLY